MTTTRHLPIHHNPGHETIAPHRPEPAARRPLSVFESIFRLPRTGWAIVRGGMWKQNRQNSA